MEPSSRVFSFPQAELIFSSPRFNGNEQTVDIVIPSESYNSLYYLFMKQFAEKSEYRPVRNPSITLITADEIAARQILISDLLRGRFLVEITQVVEKDSTLICRVKSKIFNGIRTREKLVEKFDYSFPLAKKIKHAPLSEICSSLEMEFSPKFSVGSLQVNRFAYLKIPDDVVISLFNALVERLKSSTLQKPPFFADSTNGFTNPVGAHITAFTAYELGHTPFLLSDLSSRVDETFEFTCKDIVRVVPIHWKQMQKIWIFNVVCKKLDTLRASYFLKPRPEIGEFHITFAVKPK